MWTISRVLWLPAVVALAQMTDLCPAPCLGQTPTTEPVAEVSKWNSPAYVEWLEKRSMLHQARQQAANVSASGAQWRHEFGDPRPRNAVRLASVWLLDYPGSVITAPGKSVIGTWAEPSFWSALEKLGIQLLHTGPVRRAGGIEGQEYTPTIDGWFDPISLEIDPAIGSEDEYRELVRVAGKHGGVIAGDLIPLHTGKGADFRLAQLAYRDYPGMYSMVEVRSSDWNLLPQVKGQWESKLVSKSAARELHRQGYIPGLINSNDAAAEARDWSGWSATGEVPGADGRRRRWVYLHYFKPDQPALNWLDPSFAAQRAAAGDIVKSVHQLGACVMRLDAVPFLGIEPVPGENLSRHFKHPLSFAQTNTLAFMVRKLGGFTFQELNIPLRELHSFTEYGPDLSYDFFTRAQCVHALLMQDATLLRQAFRFLKEAEIDLVSLVHDLQNHDEITYQLVELDARGDEIFELGGHRRSGHELRDKMLAEMRKKVAANPRNRLYRPEKDGIATTFAGFIAASLGIDDPTRATQQQVRQIKQAHLLLALANAMQPGVFSLSSWDLVGALPVPENDVAKWAKDGDVRWVNRGGVDLLGSAPHAKASSFGLPRAISLYGSLSEQLEQPNSFAMQLGRLLAARNSYRIAEGELWAVPDVEHDAVCLLVFKIPGPHGWAVTALNFSDREVTEKLNLADCQLDDVRPLHGRAAVDIVADKRDSKVTAKGELAVSLPAYSGKVLVLSCQDTDGANDGSSQP